MTPHPLLHVPIPFPSLIPGNRPPFGGLAQLPPGLLQALQARGIPGAMAPMQNFAPPQQRPPGMPGMPPGQLPFNIPQFQGGGLSIPRFQGGGFPQFNPFGQQPMGAMYPGFQGGGLNPGMANTQPIRGGALSLY